MCSAAVKHRPATLQGQGPACTQWRGQHGLLTEASSLNKRGHNWSHLCCLTFILFAGVMAEAGEGLAAPDASAAALAYKNSALGSHPAGMADYAFFLENGLGGLPQVGPPWLRE